MQCHSQEGNRFTDIKVKIYITSPEFIVTKTVMWEYHVEKSSKSRYSMILGRYLSMILGLNFKFSENFFKGGVRPF